MSHVHTFELIAESRQANHYWCEWCGAYKRAPHDSDNDTVHLPKEPSDVKKPRTNRR